MKKIFTLLLIVATLLTGCVDPPEDSGLSIIPFSNDNQRFGLVDLKGDIVVENEWETPSSIATDGIVRVKNKDGNYEFYTATQNPKRIGVEYQDATLFSEGLAAVVNEQGFIHYIDKMGNIKFELPDDGKGSPIQKAGVFVEGLARFQNSENLWGFINMNGEIVVKPRYDFVRNFSEGLAYVERYNMLTNEKSIGFINQMDVEIIPLSERYTSFSDFKEGLAACTDKEARNQWGFINKKEDRVIEINKLRVDVKTFQGGYAAFYDGSYWGLIDKTGEIVVNPRFDGLLSYFYNGLAPFKNSDNEIGFINPSRVEVIKNQFEEVLPFISKTTVVKDKYYIFIDKNGNSISKTYLKNVPINSIKNQYLNLASNLVKSLYININTITGAVIRKISNESVNDLSFNSSVIDVINYYKIPKSKLPKNTWQTYIENEIDLSGNIEPSRVKIHFNEPVLQPGNNLEINPRARVKSVEFRIFTGSFENDQVENIVEQIKSKIESTEYVLNLEASQSSWKPNASIYETDRSQIEISYNFAEINVKIDYSEYF